MLTQTQRQTAWAAVSITALVIIAFFAALSGTSPSSTGQTTQADLSLAGSRTNLKRWSGSGDEASSGDLITFSRQQPEGNGTEFWPTLLGYRFKITDSLLVIFTAILAASTILLWISTNRLANETATSINLARNEFLSTHRPRLIIRQCEFKDRLEADKPIIVLCSIVNIGNTPAIPKRKICNVGLYNGTNFEEHKIDTTQKDWFDAPISAGERQHLYYHSRFKITKQHLDKIMAGELFVCFLGELAYQDTTVAHVERRTGFYRTYNGATGKFEPSKDSDEEYCD